MLAHLLALTAATAVLAAIPGPNVALIVAFSLRHGKCHGLATVAGTTAGIAAQLALVLLGATMLLHAAANALVLLKWAGIVYLLLLSMRAWRQVTVTPVTIIPAAPAAWPARHLIRNGFVLAAVNPKTLLFAAAFLPQFISGTTNKLFQLLMLALAYVLTLAVVDSLWALGAASARIWLKKYQHLHHKLTAGCLALAAIALAVSHRGPVPPFGILR